MFLFDFFYRRVPGVLTLSLIGGAFYIAAEVTL